uniref:Uncharacterized protein n=1 Tax=Arundo donax TaxID=35708 RepID=A0A0A9E0Z3_ARUDO
MENPTRSVGEEGCRGRPGFRGFVLQLRLKGIEVEAGRQELRSRDRCGCRA